MGDRVIDRLNGESRQERLITGYEERLHDERVFTCKDKLRETLYLRRDYLHVETH